MADIFVSYARADKARVAPLVAALEAQGWSVWWDPAITPGQEFDSLIRRELGAARAVIVVWTPASVDSRWVRGEARLGAERGVLVPVRFDKAELPIDALSLHTTDLDDWNGDVGAASFGELCRALKALTGSAQTDKAAAHTAIPPSVPTKTPSSISGRVTPIHLATAAAVLLIVGVSFFLLTGRHSGGTGEKRDGAVSASVADGVAPGQATSADAPASNADVSLAVLPFVNMSEDKEQEYFSDGLSEELLNQLAQIKRLRVAGRTSSFAFKGKNEDLRIIAHALGVNHLLEGSVRKSGDRLRITAQLIDGADGSHLWSQSYDRKLDDVFRVQEDIAKDVADALSVTLGVGETERPMGGTSNVEAYDKYLRANELMHQLGRVEVQQASSLYRQAVTLDPNFALGWYGLYNAYSQTLVYIPEQSNVALKEMESTSQRVKALAPDAWWTKSIDATNLATMHQWGAALAAGKAAVEAAPSSEIDPALTYALILGDVGQSDLAVSYLQRASRTDPLSLTVSGYLQLALIAAGRFDESEAEYKRSKDLAGDHARWEWFEVVRLWRKPNADPVAVNAQFEKYMALEKLPLKINELAAGKLQDTAYLRPVIRQLLHDPEAQDITSLTVLAFWADHYGEKDVAFDAFRRQFIEMHSPQVGAVWAVWETGLRSDPRFKQLVRDLKLVDYWRSSGNWGDYCRPVGADDFECH